MSSIQKLQKPAVQVLATAAKQLKKSATEMVGGAQASAVSDSLAVTKPARSGEPPTVVIVGVGGIGLPAANKFAAAGYRTILADRPGDKLMEMAASVEALSTVEGPDKVLALPLKVTNAQSIKRAFKRAADFGGGKIDGMHCTVGIYKDGNLLDMSPKTYNLMADVNVKAPFLVSTAAAPYLRKSRNPTASLMGSIAGLRPVAGETNYSFFKMGTVDLVENLEHAEFERPLKPGENRIRWTAVNPGPVLTPMLHGREFAKGSILQPDHVADQLVYLQQLHPDMRMPRLILVGASLDFPPHLSA